MYPNVKLVEGRDTSVGLLGLGANGPCMPKGTIFRSDFGARWAI